MASSSSSPSSKSRSVLLDCHVHLPIIFQYLYLRTVANNATVCKAWHKAATLDAEWRRRVGQYDWARLWSPNDLTSVWEAAADDDEEEENAEGEGEGGA